MVLSNHHYVENSMSFSSSYNRTAVCLTGVNGLVLDSAATLAGSLMIIASSSRIDLPVNCLNNVGTCSGWGATTLAVVAERDLHFSWTCLAALFQVVLLWEYSTCCSANGSMICFASSAVSPAFSLSQHASLDCSMPCLSGGDFLGALRCIHPFMCEGNTDDEATTKRYPRR